MYDMDEQAMKCKCKNQCDQSSSSTMLVPCRMQETHIRVHVTPCHSTPPTVSDNAPTMYRRDIGKTKFEHLLRLASASRLHCGGNPRSFKVYHDDADGVCENHMSDSQYGASSTSAHGQTKRSVVIAPARVYTERLVADPRVHVHSPDVMLLCTAWRRQVLPHDAFPCCTTRLRDVRYVRQLVFKVHHRLDLIFEVHRRVVDVTLTSGMGEVIHEVYAEYTPSPDVMDASIADRRLRTIFGELGI